MTDILSIERTITADEVRRTLLAIGNTEGDRRNSSILVLDVDEDGKPSEYEAIEFTQGSGCYYTDPNGRHCLAGEVIGRLVGEHLLPTWGHNFNDSLVEELARGHFAPIGIRFERKALDLLVIAQADADRGETWFDAVSSADEVD